jgi:hypothetical protein
MSGFVGLLAKVYLRSEMIHHFSADHEYPDMQLSHFLLFFTKV